MTTTDLKEPDEITMRYFYIKTDRLEQFLTEMESLCRKFAVKGLEYGFTWEGL